MGKHNCVIVNVQAVKWDVALMQPAGSGQLGCAFVVLGVHARYNNTCALLCRCNMWLCRFASAQQHPNCMLLAGCMDGSVHLLHAATGQLLVSAKPHSKYVVAAAWAPMLLTACERPAQQQQQQQGEQLIATAAYDSTCCLLRVVTNHNSSSSSSSTSQQSFALEVVQQVRGCWR